MANDPRQVPDIFLPGAEYLNMVPGRSIALQGRRHQVAGTAATPVAAGATVALFTTGQIESQMTLTSGIYIHLMWAVITPSDGSGELQITGMEAGFGSNPAVNGDIGIRLGTPTVTTLNPTLEINALVEREILLPYADVVWGDGSNTGNLGVTFRVGYKNIDSTNAHSVAQSVWILYTRLDGLLYGV